MLYNHPSIPVTDALWVFVFHHFSVSMTTACQFCYIFEDILGVQALLLAYLKKIEIWCFGLRPLPVCLQILDTLRLFYHLTFGLNKLNVC